MTPLQNHPGTQKYSACVLWKWQSQSSSAAVTRYSCISSTAHHGGTEMPTNKADFVTGALAVEL